MTMTSAPSVSGSTRKAVLICLAAMISLAIAMGVGRFAFTPLFPLMIRDGLLTTENGTLLAASNYLGYLLGAMLAGRIKIKPSLLLVFGLVSTAVVTGAIGWTSSVFIWALLRFVAGIMSAWTLIAASAWSLAWLASLRWQHLAGIVFAGVGLGIAAVGVFCAVTARFAVPAVKMWIDLALLAGILVLFPWMISAQFPSAVSNAGAATQPPTSSNSPANAIGLVICYSLFGFGYILPATYCRRRRVNWWTIQKSSAGPGRFLDWPPQCPLSLFPSD